MKLKEIGEFGFIERFKPLFSEVGKGVMGIGDDCAVIPLGFSSFGEGGDLLVTTDMLLEGVHFMLSDVNGEDLGWKSLAVNISDVSGMGGVPIGSFLSIGIPNDLDVEYLDKFMAGYKELGDKFSVPLLGGDTTRSESGLAINVGVLGKCVSGKAVLRSGTRVGDVVCVSGVLGDSAGGLDVVLRGAGARSATDKKLVERHYRPMPRVDEGRFLAGYDGVVHSMMDISDGVASDLLHILKASSDGTVHLSAEIDLSSVPISPELCSNAASFGYDPIVKALSGGEDYELLFTVEPSSFEQIEADYREKFGHGIYMIGTIVEGDGCIRWIRDGVPTEFDAEGFDHFKTKH